LEAIEVPATGGGNSFIWGVPHDQPKAPPRRGTTAMNYDEAVAARAHNRENAKPNGPHIPDVDAAKFALLGSIGNTKKLNEVYVPKIVAGELDVNITEEYGRTAFQMAVWYGHTEFAAVLLAHGAKWDTWDCELWSPLHYAGASAGRAPDTYPLTLSSQPHNLDPAIPTRAL
jgi:hypothetical protein